MSFSGDIKGELCRAEPVKKCCLQAEAYGVLLFCNRFSADEIRIVTESLPFVRRLPLLFRKAFRTAFDRQPSEEREGGKHTFSIHTPSKLRAIYTAFGSDPKESVAHHINFAVLEEDHCRAAFLRGAFLAGGAATDPEKEYHLELTTTHYSVSRELAALLRDMGFSPKSIVRKSNYVTYFKQSEAIEDFLTAMGAPVSAMHMMSAKVEKQLRGSVNRRVNCDAANLDKAVDAAQEQLAAIRRIERGAGLDALSDKLKEAARLRLENPELTLSQLAELCRPPVSKSTLNHRLRRLAAIAKETPPQQRG